MSIKEILSQRKILIVDDMKTMRMIVKQTLKDLGAQDTYFAEDGAEAWKILGEGGNGIDLVVCDWNMPNMTGFELLQKCRGNADFRELAFLLVTAEQDVGQVQEAIKAGVDGYIVKPFNVDSFSTRLKLVLKKRFNYKG